MQNLKHTLTTILISVDSSKEMLGTFSPQAEPYTHEMPEETTPSGLFARGSYSARSKVILILNTLNLIVQIYTFTHTIS